MKYLISILLALFSLQLFSAELDGIKFDDSIKLENKDLVLNGIGIRRATIFKVKVYYGGLYIDKKSKDAEAVLNSPFPKQIIMNFVHDVDAKKLRNGFSDAMEAANKNHAEFKSHMEKFNSHIADVVKGDKIIVYFLADGVIVNANGKVSEKINGSEFSKALFSIWFINVADEGLRKGLLSL
jgi:hypothetical protein